MAYKDIDVGAKVREWKRSDHAPSPDEIQELSRQTGTSVFDITTKLLPMTVDDAMERIRALEKELAALKQALAK